MPPLEECCVNTAITDGLLQRPRIARPKRLTSNNTLDVYSAINELHESAFTARCESRVGYSFCLPCGNCQCYDENIEVGYVMGILDNVESGAQSSFSIIALWKHQYEQVHSGPWEFCIQERGKKSVSIYTGP